MPRSKKKQKRVPAAEPDVADEEIDVVSRNRLIGTTTRASQCAASASLDEDLPVATAQPVEDDEANEAAHVAAATGELERGTSLAHGGNEVGLGVRVSALNRRCYEHSSGSPLIGSFA